MIGRRHFETWSGPLGKHAADVTLIEGAKSGFGALGIVVSANAETYLHTAFPVASDGVIHRVRVLAVHESSFGLEACITAEIGDAKINYFEPYFALQSDLYRPNADLDVSLTGIAYVLSIPERGQAFVHPDIGKIHLDGAAMLLPLDHASPAPLPARGFGLAYVESEQTEPGLDDYHFRGTVKHVEELEFMGRPALRITTTVIRLDDGERDVDLDLYVLDEKISDGRRPLLGGDVNGVLWLQGIGRAPAI